MHHFWKILIHYHFIGHLSLPPSPHCLRGPRSDPARPSDSALCTQASCNLPGPHVGCLSSLPSSSFFVLSHLLFKTLSAENLILKIIFLMSTSSVRFHFKSAWPSVMVSCSLLTIFISSFIVSKPLKRVIILYSVLVHRSAPRPAEGFYKGLFETKLTVAGEQDRRCFWRTVGSFFSPFGIEEGKEGRLLGGGRK